MSELLKGLSAQGNREHISAPTADQLHYPPQDKEHQGNFVLVTPIKTVRDFVAKINHSLDQLEPGSKLSKSQAAWLCTVIVGIIVTERLCWALFDRRGFNTVSEDAFRWMFASAVISWHRLLQASVMYMLVEYNITSGTLVIDDSDKKRSKRTKKIYGAHKIKDKATGGFKNGQEIVFMLLVADTVTIPVDFSFHIPDPTLAKWKKENNELKKRGIPKKDRPRKPKPNTAYPTKQEIAADMVEKFCVSYPAVRILSVLADALYGTSNFMDKVSNVSKAQAISQIRKNQMVWYRNRWVSVQTYFKKYAPLGTHLVIRGNEKKQVTMYGCRIKVKAHNKKRFIVALKYEGEKEFRYLIASDLSWRYMDIARAYTLRWLVEVFIQDWKTHGGWNRLAKHQGEDGSTRGVILSLLCDHLLLCHPEQKALLKSKQSGMPAGCVIERLKNEALVKVVGELVNSDAPKAALDKLAAALKNAIPERKSSRHMSGKDLGRLEPTPSLKQQNDTVVQWEKEVA